jgi:hypothetical protein
MAWQLDRGDLQERLKEHASLNYVTIYSVMKGITLATGAFTLAVLFGEENLSLSRLCLLIVSFATMVLTYDATHVATLVMNWVPDWRDIVYPFAVAVTEFLLFFILQNENVTLFWHPVFGVFALSCSLLLSNVLSKIEESQYAPDLVGLVDDYRQSLRRDRRMSCLHGIAWIGLSLLIYFIPLLQTYHGVLALPAIVVIIVAIRGQERDRKWISRLIKTTSNVTG